MTPKFDDFYKQFIKKFPALRQGVFDGKKQNEINLLPVAEQILKTYTKKNNSSVSIDHGLNALAHMTFDFIRLQSKFLKSKKYMSESNLEVSQELYSDQSRMEGYYLDGLILSYAFWPNHLKIFNFFLEKFVKILDPTASVVEIGTGHGLMAIFLLDKLDHIFYLGFDISQYSIAYAQSLFDKNGIAPERYRLANADITNQTIESESVEKWKAGLCCEVLEHVLDPGKVLDDLHSRLCKGALVFITTVANVEAEDHVYLFNNSAEIRSLLESRGFAIHEELILTLDSFVRPGIEPINYSAIVRKQ